MDTNSEETGAQVLTNNGNQSETTPDLTSIRDLIAKAHPKTVPELITGTTAEELIASIPAAEAAYERIAGSIAPAAAAGAPAAASSAAAGGGTGSAAGAAAPHVPSGQPALTGGSFTDIEKLPPSQLIRRGVEARKRN